MSKAINISAEDHKRITTAVAEAEKGTDGEIVTIVTEQSDHYNDVALHMAIAAMFLFLSALAVFPSFFRGIVNFLAGGWQHDFTTAQYLSMILVVSAVLFLAIRYLFTIPALRMAITPGGTKEIRVRHRAIQFFKVGAERRTLGLTGILIYLSIREHRAEIVADEAIATQVDPEVWGDAMAVLLTEVKAGRPGDGMVAAVEKVGEVLAVYFPKSVDNTNELPDRLIEL
ncbi:hypothetical protein [Sphingorhabdus sp. Alg239-R122]|uniref:TPM domain-containing protein n=1 Tax=Sphingorhabdus sp. Alg239-R122 TaxID=2305989 RepID=UPI0013DD5BD7|nr:hypothetical protein [Sphingorhabdus sp. Alg239-R122]